MPWLLLIALAGVTDASAPDVDWHDPDLDDIITTEEAPFSVVVSFAPLALAVPGLGEALGALVFGLPLRASLELDEHLAFSVELAITYKRFGNEDGMTLANSLGPQFYFGGFFVWPRLSFYFDRRPGSSVRSVAVLGGFDAGYEWRRDGWRITLGIGAGAGWGSGVERGKYLLTPFEVLPFRPTDGPVVSVDLHLLRIGYAF